MLVGLYEKYQHLRLELADLILLTECQEKVLCFARHLFYDRLAQNSNTAAVSSLVVLEEVFELVYRDSQVSIQFCEQTILLVKQKYIYKWMRIFTTYEQILPVSVVMTDPEALF